MSSSTATLKRHNHRVHPCKDDKKEELLKFLLQKNSDKKIIVVTSNKTELTTEQENVSIVSDEELSKTPDERCDMLISYDLPSKAIKYMARIAHSDTYALILINPSEERIIHPIETLIGRTIMQELIEGFSEIREDKKREFIAGDEKPREEKKEYKPRNNSRGERKPWEKKEKKENKYLGKDENGKAIFSGKSGDRNHHYDGTQKAKPAKLTGKKISIKALNKKD